MRFQGFNQGTKNKLSVIGIALLNLAEFASLAEEKELEIDVPLFLSGGRANLNPSLHVSSSDSHSFPCLIPLHPHVFVTLSRLINSSISPYLNNLVSFMTDCAICVHLVGFFFLIIYNVCESNRLQLND